MNYTDRRKFNSVVEDQPVSMRDLYESIRHPEDLQGRHDRVELHEASLYRRRRAITKIFRDSRYVPSLDDIEEIDENLPDNGGYIVRASNPRLSLNSLHKERIRNTKGKTRRARSRKNYGNTARSALDTLSEDKA